MIDRDKSERGAVDAPAAQDTGKRGRGRPSKGLPVLVRLSEEERRFADMLGNGIAAEGVRVALNAVKHVGIDAVRALSKMTAAANALPTATMEPPLPTIDGDLEFPPLPPLPPPPLPEVGDVMSTPVSFPSLHLDGVALRTRRH